MNLKEAHDHYYSHTGSASNSARQLAFAGIAVVWILATELGVVEQSNLREPLLAFVSALGLDLLQYYGLAGFWGAFAWFKERANQHEFTGAPPWVNWIGLACFWSKGACVAVGYVILMDSLWPVLFM